MPESTTVLFFYPRRQSADEKYHSRVRAWRYHLSALRAVDLLRCEPDLTPVLEGRFYALASDEVEIFFALRAGRVRRLCGSGLCGGGGGCAERARSPARARSLARSARAARTAAPVLDRYARWIPPNFSSHASRGKEALQSKTGAWALRSFMEVA